MPQELAPVRPHDAFGVYAKCVRGVRRVQMRGAARPPLARRSRSTLSERGAGGNEAAGPFRLLIPVSPEAAKINAAPRRGNWFCYPREVRQGGEKGPDARRRAAAGREAYSLYVERPAGARQRSSWALIAPLTAGAGGGRP